MKKSISFEVGYALDVGRARFGKPNQDSISILMPGFFNRKPPLLVLSDGMGGYGGGEIASKLAVKNVARAFHRTPSNTSDWLKVLDISIQKAHQEIIKKGRTRLQLEAMGCTLVAAILTPQAVYVANVGDSRAYIINTQGIHQISYDHSMVAEQLRLGMLTPQEAKSHPRRNVLSLSLSAKREKVDPYLGMVEWGKEDILLLCSDGLWVPVSENEIQAVVLGLPPQKAANKLIDIANMHGGPDNISVIIAKMLTNTIHNQVEDDTLP